MIKVGAATEVEMKEKKARVEDALHATRAAVEEGIVAGGGVAYLRARANLKAQGRQRRPGRRHQDRAARDGRAAAPDRRERRRRADRGRQQGRRRQGQLRLQRPTGEYGDMVEMGVLDPTKVTRFALQNAASVARLMLTTEAMVAELPKDEKADAAVAAVAWAAWAAWATWTCNPARCGVPGFGKASRSSGASFCPRQSGLHEARLQPRGVRSAAWLGGPRTTENRLEVGADAKCCRVRG